jgi:hypothetical protein
LLLSVDDVDASAHALRLLESACFLMRCGEAAPLQLICSWTCVVDKLRGLIGTSRWRRLEINDPIGSAWAASIWQKKNIPARRP